MKENETRGAVKRLGSEGWKGSNRVVHKFSDPFSTPERWRRVPGASTEAGNKGSGRQLSEIVKAESTKRQEHQ